jgi:tetratricopeptide (TPR) repeat protein
MSSVPFDPAELRVELERHAADRAWGDIRDRTSALDDSQLLADPKVAYLVSEALFYLGLVERALNLVLAAEVEFRVRNDPVNLLSAVNLAGAVLFELGDLTGAEERFADLLELARERGDDEMSGRATNNLGAIASLRGEHEQALSLFRLSIPAYQKVGFTAGLAQTSHNLGIVHRDLGYWREAERHYSDALRRARQLGDRRLAAMARAGRAEILYRRGDVEFAAAEATRALDAFVATGDELGRADALRLLGGVAAVRSDVKAARKYFDDALDIAQEHENLLLEAEILEGRAELHTETAQAALARADLQLAAAAYRRLGAVKRLEQVEVRLADRS